MLLAPINISIIDSRDDVKLTYVVVNDCKVPVLKTKINDACYVLMLVNDVCHIKLDMTEDCLESR